MKLITMRTSAIPLRIPPRSPICSKSQTAADLLIANGAFPSPFPNIVGHEGSGKVIKVGKAVTRVKEGDSVLLSFSYDQKCKICRAGHPAACKVSSDANGHDKENDS